MSDRITKSQRWLDLIAYLVARRLPVAVDELMERIPSYAGKWRTGDESDRAAARRMFERDKDELRSLGVPIETVAYSIHGAAGEETQGYRLARRDFYLPYLRVLGDAQGTGTGTGTGTGVSDPQRVEELPIDEADLGTALRALEEVAELPAFPYAAEARSAARKLSFDAPVPASEPEPHVHFPAPPDSPEQAGKLRTLTDALFARKTASFVYHGIARDEATEREVRPYGVLFQHGHWYLVAFDPMRDGMRVFRLDRMRDVARNTRRPNTADYEVPADFDLSEYAEREAWELGPDDARPVRALVHFRFPRSLWAERNDHGELIEEADDGSAVRAFEVTQADPFLRWLLSMGGEAVVREPAELADAFRVMARRVATTHGGSGA